MGMAWKAAAAGLIFAGFAAQAQEYKLGDITIGHPWARPTAGTNMMGAAYLTLKNSGKEADTLKSVSSPDAEKAEIHEHIHDAGGVTVPPGGTISFEPGAYHLMLIGLKHNLEEGHGIPLKLSFAHAGDIDVEVKIEKKPEAGTGAMHEHHH